MFGWTWVKKACTNLSDVARSGRWSMGRNDRKGLIDDEGLGRTPVESAVSSSAALRSALLTPSVTSSLATVRGCPRMLASIVWLTL
jgi:hypothetical protein